MTNENDFLKIKFSFTNEFNEKTKLEKKYTLSGITFEDTPLDFLLNTFKEFLLNCGFHEETVNNIKYE